MKPVFAWTFPGRGCRACAWRWCRPRRRSAGNRRRPSRRDARPCARECPRSGAARRGSGATGRCHRTCWRPRASSPAEVSRSRTTFAPALKVALAVARLADRLEQRVRVEVLRGLVDDGKNARHRQAHVGVALSSCAARSSLSAAPYRAAVHGVRGAPVRPGARVPRREAWRCRGCHYARRPTPLSVRHPRGRRP